MFYKNQLVRILTVFLLCGALLTACAPPDSVSAEAVLDSMPQKPSQSSEQEDEPVVFTNIFKENNNKEAVDERLDLIAQSCSVLGWSVAAFEHDQIVYTHSFGTANLNTGAPATEDTKYRIASISKLVTTMLAMQLKDQGKLSLKDDIAQTIHPKLQNPVFPNTTTTLEMLLTHTSGIVDGAGYSRATSIFPFPPLDTALAYNNFTGEEPGTAYHYSNFGLGMVSAAIEKASGKYFYDYARDELFEPMGIDASYITDYIKDQSQIAAFRWDDPASWGSMKYIYGNIPLGQMYLLGHGELYISAKDLAKVAMILAGNGTYQGKTYLTQESVDDIHAKRLYDPITNVSRGLAAQISPDIVKDVTFYGHQGNAYGAISGLFYDPDTERGVVVLTNGANGVRAESQVYAMNDAVVKLLWEYLSGSGKEPEPTILMPWTPPESSESSEESSSEPESITIVEMPDEDRAEE